MISYELSYADVARGRHPAGRSLSLREVVDSQAGRGSGSSRSWYIFLQPIGFIIYVIAGIAETNRAPFDFPEAEQELVAGFNTEYSSVRFALFPQAEYINMVTMSAVATDLYLGGWHFPGHPGVAGRLVFIAKIAASCSSTSGCGGRCRATATTS
jgi:NADH-quinone oxidoreductase subunit H